MKITIELNEKEFEELKDLIFLTEGTNDLKEENEKKEEKHLRYKVDNIVFRDYEIANKVRDDLIDMADKYSFVTVADYKDLSGIETKYIDNHYGWSVETIRVVPISRHNGGYILALPLAMEIR